MTEKYAVAECERRFLLSEIPPAASNPRVISDLYVEGTRLRVRLVAAEDGEALERKLGHKRRLIPGDPTFHACDVHPQGCLNLRGRELERDYVASEWVVAN